MIAHIKPNLIEDVLAITENQRKEIKCRAHMRGVPESVIVREYLGLAKDAMAMREVEASPRQSARFRIVKKTH